MRSRREFIRMLGTGTVAAVAGKVIYDAAATDRAPLRRPNFVFILIDDLGWTDLGFMGSKYYETPRIDALASEGVVFKQAYSNAPNCAPTRACLMSGQYTPRHGVYTVGTPERGRAERRKLIPTPNTTELGTEHVTIAEALNPAGYTCACIGKWHLGGKAPYRPQDRGFDVVYDRSRRGHYAEDGQYLTDRLTDESVKFIKTCRDKPFFLYLSHHAVHTPIQAKAELTAKYERKTPVGGHDNPKYAAMIESVDQSVGRVLVTLEELGLAQNTAVFFFSDNGGYANATSIEPLRGSKGMLYEGGIRVPTMVRWPGVTRAGRACDVPIIGTDFYPTILEMAGAPKPKGYTLDGESLVPLLAERAGLKRDAIFWHFPAYLEPYNDRQWPWRITPAGAIRQGDWKLIEFFEDGHLELYNLRNDISETNNLADKEPERAKTLHAKLVEWRQRVHAPVPQRLNPQFDPTALKRS
ncbi:MAG: sulfatase [Phycisphaerales bacterium]|nr:MAG: sulfatase [Phycisphaerales bacterium]